MCNLYSLTKGQAAIRAWFRAGRDRTGNLPLFPGIFPDQMAPIVRNGVDGERELVMARWGMPGPPQFCCWLMRPRLSNCNGRCLTMRYELSRVERRRMARARPPPVTRIKNQCFHFDRAG